MTANQLTLIYDGNCAFCGKTVDWVMHRVPKDSVEALPCQSPQRAERYPDISEEECMKAIYVVLPDGRSFSGAAGLPFLFAKMAGWRWMAGLLRLPGVSALAPHVYGFVARHRHTLSGFVPTPQHSCGIHQKNCN